MRARWPRNQQLKAEVLRHRLGPGALEGTVVELGCGTAQIAAELLAAAPRMRYVGLDLSPRMLAVAEERLRPYASRVELRAVHGALPLEAIRADAAFGVDVLHHVANPVGVLAELADALLPGAPVAFLEGNPRFPITTAIALLQREERGLLHITPGNLRRWLGEAGLADAEVELGPLYTPPGPAPLVPLLDGIDRLAATVPGLRSLAIFYVAAARRPLDRGLFS